LPGREASSAGHCHPGRRGAQGTVGAPDPPPSLRHRVPPVSPGVSPQPRTLESSPPAGRATSPAPRCWWTAGWYARCC